RRIPAGMGRVISMEKYISPRAFRVGNGVRDAAVCEKRQVLRAPSRHRSRSDSLGEGHKRRFQIDLLLGQPGEAMSRVNESLRQLAVIMLAPGERHPQLAIMGFDLFDVARLLDQLRRRIAVAGDAD